jgi:hypothetical protein
MQKDFTKKMISPREVALIFSISPGTLGNWRSARKGPRFFKVGHKILYKVEDLETFFTSAPVLTLDSLPEAR